MKNFSSSFGLAVFSLASILSAAHAGTARVLPRIGAMAVPTIRLDQGLGTFDQKLDPASVSDSRTFKQRYYIDPTYATGTDSPVFYYICGEANCFDAVTPYPPFVQDQAYQNHGYIVMLEHRYFGESQPFDTMTTENLKYLTIENAIADLANFQRAITEENKLTGKWISIGGSYPGALSAFYRLKHPELVVGAIASSAPVRAKADFVEYDQYVAKGLDAKCLKVTQDINHRIEAALYFPDQLAKIEDQFGIKPSELTDPRDVLGFVEFVSGSAVQYGKETEYCDSIESADEIQGLAAVSVALLSMTGTTVAQTLPSGSASIQAKDNEAGVGYRQWNWLTCTQFGDFSMPYPDPAQSAESQLLDLKYNEAICASLFPGGSFNGTDAVNAAYYSQLLKPSTKNIVFTNGATDPWSSLSIVHELHNDTNPGTKAITVPGGSHCNDLQYTADSAPGFVKPAIEAESKIIAGWLKR